MYGELVLILMSPFLFDLHVSVVGRSSSLLVISRLSSSEMALIKSALLSLLLAVAQAEVVRITTVEQFETSIISSPEVWLGLFVDMGLPGEETLDSYSKDAEAIDALEPSLSNLHVALINFNVKEISLEYNVRRRRPKGGKWKSFLWNTRSRAAEEVSGYEGTVELAAKVKEMTSSYSVNDGGKFVKTTLALGGEPEPEHSDAGEL